MYADAMVVIVGTAVAKIVGALKVIVTARYFGASDALDAFLIAFLLPSFFCDVIAGCLTPSFVPVLTETRDKEGEAAAHRAVQETLAFGLAVLSAGAVVLAGLGHWLLPVLGSGFNAAKLGLAQSLFLLLLLWLPGGACIVVWRAVLNACGAFALAATAPILTPVLTIAGLWLLPSEWGAYTLCAGTLAGVLAELIVLAVAVKRLGFPITPALSGWRPGVGGLARRYFPLATSGMASSAAVMIDQAVAATLAAGSVSMLSYGSRLVTVVIEVTSASIGTAALPAFSRMVSSGDWANLRRSSSHFSILALAAAVPVTVVLMLFAQPVVGLVFQRGAFDASATQVVSRIFRFALLQLPFAALLAVASRLAIAVGATSVVARVAVAGCIVNLAGDLLLSRWMGVAGIALATSITQVISLTLLLTLLPRSERRLLRVI